MTPRDFLTFLYPAQDPTLSLWDPITKLTLHSPLSALPAAPPPYYGVASRAPGLAPHQRGTTDQCLLLPALWLDVDRKHPTAHASPDLPSTEDDLAQLLTPYPEPTLLVDSGYGWHAYWVLNSPIPVTPTLRAQSKVFQALAASSPWKLDDTSDLARMLRLPGTLNTKIPDDPRLVTVLYHDGPRYDLSALVASLPAVPSRPQVSAAPPPDPQRALIQTPQYVQESLKRLTNPATIALMAPVLAGAPFAPPGQRDSTLQRIASTIAFLAPDADPALLASALLGPSLKALPHTKHGADLPSRLHWATDKIERAQSDARARRAHEEAETQATLSRFSDQVRASARRAPDLPPAPTGPYTPDELTAFQASQRTPDFTKRWIIQRNSSYWVYVNGDYQPPITQAELDVSLPRDLAPAQALIDLTVETPKGRRPKTSKELLRDYATVARHCVSHLELSHSYYDNPTQTFHEAVCPIRPIHPHHYPEIDTWLHLLGGTHAPALLDWVATITHLSKPSSALYLEGAPGTGKGLLAFGLARLWHTGGPTEIRRILAEWSDDISRCPLIFADERLPADSSGQIRELIGNSGRTLTRKHLSNSHLSGNIRLILAANNPEMLAFDEVLSQDDLQAISSRFLHVPVDQSPRDYLATISTEGWVTDDKIAQHALWLRDHRRVTPGPRFVVQGDATSVARQLATRGPTPGKIAEWLVRFLCDSSLSALQARQTLPQTSHLAIVGGGALIVSTMGIVRHWELFSHTKNVPPTPSVGAALKNLSLDQRRYGTKRYHVVDLEALKAWSEANLVGSPDLIEERVNIPLSQEYLESLA